MSDSSSEIGIAAAIANLRAEIEEAMKDGVGKQVRFLADEITVELLVGFTSSKEGKAGVKVWVAEIGGGLKRDDTTSHKVTLKLKIEGSNRISDTDVPHRARTS
jgi:hypothetical protein